MMNKELCLKYTKILSLGFFSLWRREVWTSVCYHMLWGFEFGKEKKYDMRQNRRSNALEPKKWRAIFLRQKLFVKQLRYERLRWSLMKRTRCATDEDREALKSWLKDNYPDITIDLNKMPKEHGYSYTRGAIIMAAFNHYVTWSTDTIPVQ